ncbi:hypothetical protein LBMAG20_13500 [Methylocystaceae bacterium]|nr:hypothetical protein LBMAG20_13500 [Methylocystaceae bacterium]
MTIKDLKIIYLQNMAEEDELKSKGLWEQPLTPRKVVGHEYPLARRVQAIPPNHRVGARQLIHGSLYAKRK